MSRSCGRQPSSQVSSVTTSAVNPAAFARSSRLSADVVVVGPVQLEPAQRRRRSPSRRPRARTDETVDSAMPMPSSAATRATARSASGCTIDCTPIGAVITGAAQRRAEHGGGQVAIGRAGEHARHDPPPVEGLAVGPRGGARAGRARRRTRTARVQRARGRASSSSAGSVGERPGGRRPCPAGRSRWRTPTASSRPGSSVRRTGPCRSSPPARRSPGGTANSALPVCRMYSLSRSCAPSRRWIGTNCVRGSFWNAMKNSPASSRPVLGSMPSV